MKKGQDPSWVQNAILLLLAVAIVVYRVTLEGESLSLSAYGFVLDSYRNGKGGFPYDFLRIWGIVMILGFACSLMLSAVDDRGLSARLQEWIISSYYFVPAIAVGAMPVILLGLLPLLFLVQIVFFLILSFLSLVYAWLAIWCMYRRWPLSMEEFKTNNRHLTRWILALVILDTINFLVSPLSEGLTY